MRRPPPARVWTVEILLAVLGFAIGLFFLLAPSPTESAEPLSLSQELPAGVGCAVALVLFRRRRPVCLAVVLIPFAIVFAMAMGTIMVALFTVAVHRSWRVTVPVAATHATAVVGVYRLAIADDLVYWESVLTVVLLHVALVAVGMLVRSQRLLVRSAQERARQAEEGQRLRVEEARHLERERLAREMHDVLAHRISLIAVHAGALEVRRNATGEERQAAGVIRQCAYDALEDLREVIGMLRDPADHAFVPPAGTARPGDPAGPAASLGTPRSAGEHRVIGAADRPAAGDPADRPQPTLADLPDLVEQSRRAGATILLDDRITEPSAVPTGIGRHTYRIVQEALTNARKHAPGAPVRIALAGRAGSGLTVEVDNPPPGAGAPRASAPRAGAPGAGAPGAGGPAPAGTAIPGAGAGLIGLRERAALVGGRLEHEHTGDGGFRLRAWLPWRP